MTITRFDTRSSAGSFATTLRSYVDNTLISTNNGGIATALNRIYVGDGTGASNSQSEIKEFRFLQGASTATQGTSWGRIKTLYR